MNVYRGKRELYINGGGVVRKILQKFAEFACLQGVLLLYWDHSILYGMYKMGVACPNGDKEYGERF